MSDLKTSVGVPPGLVDRRVDRRRRDVDTDQFGDRVAGDIGGHLAGAPGRRRASAMRASAACKASADFRAASSSQRRASGDLGVGGADHA